jgi:hypothetical protein
VSGETRSGNGTEIVDDVVKREQVDSIKRMDSNGEQTRLGRERADKDRKDFGSTTANNNRIADDEGVDESQNRPWEMSPGKDRRMWTTFLTVNQLEDLQQAGGSDPP